MSTYVIGVDIGGTFTDAFVARDDGAMFYSKVPTTPEDLSLGVMNSLSEIAKSANVPLRELLKNSVKLAHGTTATVNGFIQRQGGKVGLITTAGFRDHLIIMNGSRGAGLPEAERWRYSRSVKPEPLVPLSLTETVNERIDYAGKIVVPLDHEQVKEATRRLVKNGVDAIAISFLWSYVNPVHEQEAKKIAEGEAPGIMVMTGSELSPVHGEYERTFSVVVNCFLAPVLERYVKVLQNRLANQGLQYPCLLMQSFGGLIPADQAPRKAATTLVSGLAGGIVGSQYLGELLGYKNILTTDMGGTSFEVGIIYDGIPVFDTYPFTPQHLPYEARWRSTIPTLDITAIGAGGGSIAWIDGNILKVGPTSAQAVPGPACYGKGGTEPTLTDANLLLGYLDPAYFLGGKMKISEDLARNALKKVADPLGMDLVEAAIGIHDVVSSEMADLTRSVALGKGYDPREFALIAFGGSGPMHVGEYGLDLGVQEILIPGRGFATAHSAFGIAVSDLKTTLVQTERMAPISAEWASKRLKEMDDLVTGELRRWGARDITLHNYGDMHYKGQAFEITVPFPRDSMDEASVQEIYEKFESMYESLYGKGTTHLRSGIELTNLRVEGTGRTPKPSLPKYEKVGPDPSRAVRAKKDVFFKKFDGFVKTPVYYGEKLKAGNVVGGPAVIQYEGTTVVVYPDLQAGVDEYLNLVLRRSD